MKKKLCILAMTIFMLTCAACGGNLETTINLNSDLSGTREMKYTITKEDFSEYVSGDITAVDATIAANVPATMSYSLTEDESNYIATFTMDFSSPEDEAAKITEVVNDGTEYNVDFIVSDSVFCNGFSYEEDVYAESLMSWFETLMVNSGYVSSADSSYIIESSSSKITYNGVTAEGGSYIEASTMEYVSIEEMRIFTTINADGSYSRTMEMDITEANLSINSDEIKAFMDESVPAGATGEWTNELGLNTHTVILENVSAADMQTAMNTYTHTSDCVFTIGASGEDDSLEKVLFAENASFDEHLNMSQYGCNSNGTVEVYYYIESDKVDGTLNYSWGDADGEPNYEVYYGYDNEEQPGFEEFDFYQVREIDVKYAGQYYYHFGGGFWDTTVKNAKDITRAITLMFDDGTTPEQAQALVDRINEQVKASEEKMNIEAEVIEEDEANGIKIEMSGSALEVEAAMNYLTNEDRSNSITYAEEDKWLGLKNTCVFNESVNFDGLVRKEYGDEYWDITLDYSLDMPGTNPNAESYDETQYDAETGKVIGTVLTSDSISKGAVTEKFNGTAIVWILVLVASIILFLVGILFIILGFVKKSKEKKVAPAPVAQQAPQQAAPVVQPTPVVEQPVSVAETPVVEEASATEEVPATEETPAE